MGLNLLEKTELWINNVTLNNVNLNEVANAVALTLKMDIQKVLVVDVRPNHITLDILENNIPQENIIGTEKRILRALNNVKGVNISSDTYIHSNGILGTICLQEENASEICEKISGMEKEIRAKIAKRVIVFPTGFELKQNLIEDTNTPYLLEIFENEGFAAVKGKVIEDDLDIATFELFDAVSRGFGVIITTGGVGAEDKDWSVEALLNIDPEAAVEYIVKFEKGTGRHLKDGVRIGVGQLGESMIITLPGPNDEVRLVGPVLVNCIRNNESKYEISKKIAEILSKRLIKNQHQVLHKKH
jgi:molybdenum cofactor synthesis domain-containing protein